MLVTKKYNRIQALEYAEKWALAQNPIFFDFDDLGGNCTNFTSQCLYAGSCVMNFTPIFGWYFISDSERTASWAGVEFFYNFFVGNKGEGPFGVECTKKMLEVGDIIQLGREGDGYFHSLFVVGIEDDEYFVAAQSDDVLGRKLSSYRYDFARYLHVSGVRIDVPDYSDCFKALYDGEYLPIYPPQEEKENIERAIESEKGDGNKESTEKNKEKSIEGNREESTEGTDRTDEKESLPEGESSGDTG